MEFPQNVKQDITMEQYQVYISRLKGLEIKVNEETSLRVLYLPIGKK
jgi:hypothetical protein